MKAKILVYAPIEQPMKFEFMIPEDGEGKSVSRSLLARADKVLK